MSIREQFVAFINEQPDDKQINHDGWKSCAVGEFAQYRNATVDETVASLWEAFGTSDADKAVMSSMKWGVDVPIRDQTTLMEVLNTADQSLMPTYGVLKQMIVADQLA